MNRWALLLMYLVFQSTPLLRAQHVSFQHFGIDDGLPSSSIYAIHQDRRGYIWFGTDAGLCRYNGEDVKTFTVSDGLPDNDILGFYEDSADRLWVYSYNGQPGFVRNDSCFSHINTDWLPSLQGNFFTTMVWESPEKGIYFCNGLLYYLEPKSEAIPIEYKLQRLLNISCMRPRPEGGVVSVNSTRKVYFSEDHLFQKAEFSPMSANVKGVTKSILRQNGNHIVFSGAEVFEWGGEDLKKVDIHLDEDITTIYEMPNKNLWVGTFSGVYIYDSTLTLRDSLLKGKTITGVLKDTQANYWLTTLGNGVYTTSDPQAISWGSEEGVGALYALGTDANEKLWAAGAAEILYSFSNHRLEILSLNDGKRSVSERRLLRLTLDKNQKLLAAGDSDMFVEAKDGFTGYNMNSVKDIAVHPNGQIYYANSHGIIYWREDLRQYAKERKGQPPFSLNPLTQFAELNILRGRATALEFDEDSNLYVGNKAGLWTGRQDQSGAWEMALDSQLTQGGIVDLELDPAGNLWGAVAGLGIFKRTTDSTLIWMNTTGQLFGTLAQRLHIESEHDIWVATQVGLAYLQYRNGNWNWRLFGEREGLISTEVNDVTILRDTLWIATGRGLTAIPRQNLMDSEQAPRMHLAEIQIQGEKIALDTSLELSYGASRFQVGYEALSFGTGGKVQYRYRMLGMDTLWTTTQATEVSFNSIPSGQYRFEVCGRRGVGPWSKEVGIAIYVARPWWQVWWIWVVIGIAYIALVWQIFQARLRRVRRKAAMEKMVMESEQKALRAQMNPHFIFNALNSVQQFFLNKRLREGNTFLNKFSKLIRLILENSDQMYLSLEEELEMIRPYMEFEQLRNGDKFDFELHIDPDLDSYNTLIPGMLIQPLLENSVWHGIRHLEGKGSIWLSFIGGPNELTVQVKDNGVGREKAASHESSERKEHRSMGLMLIRDRIEVINALGNDKLSLSIMDLKEQNQGNSTGTMVEIRIKSNRYV